MGVDSTLEYLQEQFDSLTGDHKTVMLCHVTKMHVRQFVQALRDSHRECSRDCPKFFQAEKPCLCGAEAWNNKIEKLLQYA
jgi:hypothetical protein